MAKSKGPGREATQFKPGHPGGPGRPPGSRNKLEEDFVRDMVTVWEESGIAAVRHIAKNEQAKFVQVAASILPKEVKVKHEFEGLTAEQLEAKIRELNAAITAELGQSARASEASTGEATSGTKH